MKSAIDELSEIYDHLYDQGQQVLNKFHPCHAGYLTCKQITFCCGNCEYLSSEGCTTKALWCKLWLCYSARDSNNKECKERLFALKMLSNAAGFTDGRISKKDNLHYIRNVPEKELKERIKQYKTEVRDRKDRLGAWAGRM